MSANQIEEWLETTVAPSVVEDDVERVISLEVDWFVGTMFEAGAPSSGREATQGMGKPRFFRSTARDFKDVY